ncbi:hypothetical protein BKA56DRAFT_668185 [Ilyonectria sp. MPI-CAGE-AT-0026]|nr:hypothetical protein BKA56DRAFT_668185 [Ilyonectria sp. MPI-CAGE-AT-0026]
MSGCTIFYAALLFWTTLVAVRGRQEPLQSPATAATPGRITPQGCFGSLPANATEIDPDERTMGSAFASPGQCRYLCNREEKPVMILHKLQCFCADTYPSRLALIDDDQCNFSCPGYDLDACGGSKAYSVWNTGLEVDVEYEDADTPPPSFYASASTYINDAVNTFSATAIKFAKNVQIFFNYVGHSESDRAKQSSKKSDEVQPVVDL